MENTKWKIQNGKEDTFLAINNVFQNVRMKRMILYWKTGYNDYWI